ncbi:MAG: hypothetical protein ACJA08_003389, partial [Cyclobacteriaceae bacterium]
MKIDIKPKVTSEFEGYEYLIQIYRLAEASSDLIIELSFNYCTWFEANLAAVLGAIVELLNESGKRVYIYHVNPRVALVMRKNGFLCGFGYEPAYDQHGTILRYQQFTPKDDDDFSNYIKTELLTKPDFPKHSKALGKKISESIFELYENARTHGRCKKIHTCGQYYPQKRIPRLDVTIVDMGITIKKNVSTFLNKNCNG